MKIKAKIPEIKIPKSIPKNRFFNNMITYFLINGLLFGVIEKNKKIFNKTVQFNLNKINRQLDITSHYSTVSETIREMVINYILLPEKEKEKIIRGEIFEKYQD